MTTQKRQKDEMECSAAIESDYNGQSSLSS